ncbi:MAG: hypothetical protein R3C25_07485 [Hyphomonadaceae bacterium]
MKRFLLPALVLLCVVILGFEIAAYFRQDPDAARRSHAVEEMAANWSGEVRFEASYDALNPDAAPAAEGQASASGVFDPNDEYWGLPRNQGYEDVAAYCSACHSLQLVMQQNRSERRWNELLDWMISQQGMPAPPAEDRQRLVAYLTRNFGESSAQPAAP